MKRTLWSILVALYPAIGIAAVDLSGIQNAKTLEELDLAYIAAVEKRNAEAGDSVSDADKQAALDNVRKTAEYDNINPNKQTPETPTGSEDTESATTSGDDDKSDNKPDTTAPRTKSAAQIEAERAASEARIDKLQENADALKANQQSAANKLVTGAAIGTVGSGLMMTLQADAEQNADSVAESDMSTYLNSFKCDYGAGKNVMGGDANIELPGMNTLTPLFSEYAALASDLKARKESLGLTPGIESELILDAANTGLYQNASLGITDGHYASWARALMNPAGDDAAELAEQKKSSQTKTTAGTAVGGVGLIGGAVGNAIINRDKK